MRLFVIAVATLLGACALLSRPEPETTLLLRLPQENALRWPAALQLGNVSANSALNSNRVLVVDDATLMQHAGVRWVDTPAVMLAEQLQMMQAQREVETVDVDDHAALDVRLTAFQVSINDRGERTVEVSANAVIRCPNTLNGRTISPPSAKLPLTDSDHASIAKTFADATSLMLSSLLDDLPLKPVYCGSEPDA